MIFSFFSRSLYSFRTPSVFFILKVILFFSLIVELVVRQLLFLVLIKPCLLMYFKKVCQRIYSENSIQFPDHSICFFWNSISFYYDDGVLTVAKIASFFSACLFNVAILYFKFDRIISFVRPYEVF